MKIRPVGAELFYAGGGQTDMTKLIVAFHGLAKVPKKGVREYLLHYTVENLRIPVIYSDVRTFYFMNIIHTFYTCEFEYSYTFASYISSAR
jgi:hypothetical protein